MVSARVLVEPAPIEYTGHYHPEMGRNLFMLMFMLYCNTILYIPAKLNYLSGFPLSFSFVMREVPQSPKHGVPNSPNLL